MKRIVHCEKVGGDLGASVRAALEGAGILTRITAGSRVALKPNFTFPQYKMGVTTSPAVIRETVKVLKDYTSRIAVVESDGGYGAWSARASLSGHGMFELGAEFGIEVVDLGKEHSKPISFPAGRYEHTISLPVRLLENTDLLISMPVPKIHNQTGLTLSMKNLWGCIPDPMRLRNHFVFAPAIVAITKALRPAVLADGTFFLDHSGPMFGDAVRMDLIIGASDCGSFDRYASELMGWKWQRIDHLRLAEKEGQLPALLDDVACNAPPPKFNTREFKLKRTLRAWIATVGFQSSFLTWLGYESWLGRGPLHWALWAFTGKPVRAPHEPESGEDEPKSL